METSRDIDPSSLWRAVTRLHLVRVAAAAVVLGALVVVAINEPRPAQWSAAAAVAACVALGFALWRFRLLSSAVFSAGGAVAVAMTDRDFFAFWVVGAALLYLSGTCPQQATARAKRRIAAAGAVAGLVAAALDRPDDMLPPLWPVLVAALLVAIDTAAQAALKQAHTRAEALADTARELRLRAETSERELRDAEHRTALAREIHDSVGHHVTAMIVQAEAGQVGHATESLHAIADLGRAAMDELESILFDLRSPHPGADEPRTDLRDIDHLAAPLRQHGVNVQVHIEKHSTDLPLHVRSALYRIAQEALTNVMRHAHATSVEVTIGIHAGEALLCVTDNGVGIATGHQSTGSGLQGMRERCDALGGTLAVTNLVPQGTQIEVRLPAAGTAGTA